MADLEVLEKKSIFIIREAYAKFRKMGLLWSIGKDSTTMVWLARKAFFGRLPFPLIHIDTGHKFPEMYEFRDRWAKEWGAELVIARNEEAIKKGVICRPRDSYQCASELKTKALQMAVEGHGFDAIMAGIRRDEHGIRAKERVFSPRDKDFRWDYADQPAEVWDIYGEKSGHHMRIHPMLHWTELDVWEYIKKEGIPFVNLYLAKNGRRYRSLGCMPTTAPVESEADTLDKIIEELKAAGTEERAGREIDKENIMQKLRSLGYM